MPYSITYQPINRISGIGPKTVKIDTAAAAWAEVQMFHASDEKTEIRDDSGQIISWEELRDIAAREAN